MNSVVRMLMCVLISKLQAKLYDTNCGMELEIGGASRGKYKAAKRNISQRRNGQGSHGCAKACSCNCARNEMGVAIGMATSSSIDLFVFFGSHASLGVGDFHVELSSTLNDTTTRLG